MTLVDVAPRGSHRAPRRVRSGCALPPSAPPLVDLARRMGAEGAIALVAGVLAGSIALVAFGIDSAIEGFASLVIVWRFTAVACTRTRPSGGRRSSSPSSSSCSPRTSPPRRCTSSLPGGGRDELARHRPRDDQPSACRFSGSRSGGSPTRSARSRPAAREPRTCSAPISRARCFSGCSAIRCSASGGSIRSPRSSWRALPCEGPRELARRGLRRLLLTALGNEHRGAAERAAPQAVERLVRLLEREASTSVRTGTVGASARNSSPSRARQVRDRADDPLAPEQLVRERRDVAHVDAGADDRAALAHVRGAPRARARRRARRRSPRRAPPAAGSRGVARPGRAERARERLAVVVAGRVTANTRRPWKTRDLATMCAAAPKPYRPSALGVAGEPQRAVADQPRAEERRGLLVG